MIETSTLIRCRRRFEVFAYRTNSKNFSDAKQIEFHGVNSSVESPVTRTSQASICRGVRASFGTKVVRIRSLFHSLRRRYGGNWAEKDIFQKHPYTRKSKTRQL